jgi:O-antigen ligase
VKSTRKLVVYASLLGLCVLAIVAMAPAEVWTSDLALLFVICGSVLAAMFVTYKNTPRDMAERLGFRLGMVLWWFLLCSEAFFPRSNNGIENAAAGKFALTAYTEAMFWVFLAVCFLIVCSRDWPRMTHAFRGRRMLLPILALICVLSVAWAPEKSYSLAWSFKLLLGIAIASYCAVCLRTLRDLRSLLIVTFWAFAFLTLAPVVEATVNPSSAFGGTSLGREAVIEQGRFHTTTHPLTIGGRAGILSLLALLFYSLERKRKMIAVAFGCAVIVALAGAKTAFLAAAISVALFFALRKRLMAGFAFVAAVAVLALLVISMTAVGSYVRDYMHNDEFMTLSGRTDLWAAAWPEITSHIAIGHGYVASKLVSMETGIPWYAGHMHNAVLESLYNNGLLGFLPIVLINAFIIADLVKLYRHAGRQELRLVAMSLLAIYAFVFLNGLTEPYFGGQASAFYLLFIALFCTAEWLRAYSAEVVPQEQPMRQRTVRPMISPVFR